MQRFTQLYLELDATTRTSEKTAALQRYFEEAAPADAAWALNFLSGARFRRAIPATLLRDWTAAEAKLPAWLVGECHGAVGDLAETLALLIPHEPPPSALPLHEIVERRISPLASMDDATRRYIVLRTWREFDFPQRLVFNKLVLGAFRVGVAKQLVTNALAAAAGIAPAIMAHRLLAPRQPTAEHFLALLAETDSELDVVQPYPLFLAHPLEHDLEALGDVRGWQIEMKWDGIRAQVIKRSDQIMLWSRGDEVLNPQFPEIETAARALPNGTVIDGEVLAWESGRPLPFAVLQRRLGRKRVEPMLFTDVPIAFLAFDVMECDSVDVRERTMRERRTMLEAIVNALGESAIQLSPCKVFDAWQEGSAWQEDARALGAEGLMLKRLSSTYQVGRKRGDWWKWKIEPYTIDAVLLAAQLGSGKRASLYTDYTFGVWDHGELVPIAKAYSGLTDEEIQAVDRHIRRNITAKHGPVRMVKPELVFELAFEGVQESTRHKAGLAVRFPRIARQRMDKKIEEADTLDALRRLLLAHRGRFG